MCSLKSALKNFVRLAGKQLRCSLSPNKVAGWRPETILKETPTLVLFCELGETFNSNKAGFFKGRYFFWEGKLQEEPY